MESFLAKAFTLCFNKPLDCVDLKGAYLKGLHCWEDNGVDSNYHFKQYFFSGTFSDTWIF